MTQNPETKKPRAVGINHVALAVGDIGEALEFYGQLFDLRLRSQSETSAFIDLGDQFIALFKGPPEGPDRDRHFGLVVDDPELGRRRLEEMGVELMDGHGVDFRDPWGNYVQLVTYGKIQYTKPPEVMRAMGLDDVAKTEDAKREFAEKFAAG